MELEITVALITLAGSAIGSISGILVSSKLTNYRIEQLEKKVEKHNSVMERTYELEMCYRLHAEKIKDLEERDQ